MSTITDQLTNRDIALLVWLAVVVVAMLATRDLRRSLTSLVAMLFWSKLTFLVLAMVAYVALVIGVGYEFGAWQPWMLKDTLYWFFGSAVTTFFAANQASKDEHFFRRKLLANLRFAVVIGFLINLYVFSLVAELLLLPVLVVLTMLLVVADTKPTYAPLKTVLQWLSTIIGLALVVRAGATAISDPRSVATLHNLQDLLLPLALTLLFLPLIYGFALFLAYDGIHAQLRIFGRNKQLVPFSMWQIVKTCRWRLSRVRRLADHSLVDIRTAETRADVLAAIREFKAALGRSTRNLNNL